MYQLAPTLDTNIYASGDTLFSDGYTLLTGVPGPKEYLLQSFTVVDASDQGTDMTLLFMNEGFFIGTVNEAISVDDTSAAKIMGSVNLAASGATWLDLGGSKMITVVGCGLILPAPIYVGAIILGTPTYAATSLTFKFGLVPVR